MASLYDSRERLKYVFIVIAILIAIISLIVSDSLIKKLAQEERQKLEIWAEATRFLTSNDALSNENMNLVFKIINSNTTIPVILCDENDNIIDYNNLSLPGDSEKELMYTGKEPLDPNKEELLKNKLRVLKTKKEPILVDLDGVYQYLYYDDSIILKRLLIYPYVQLSVIFLFIALAFLALASTKKAEQNKVWVGLSKETAHQLGTPISSLIAWLEYLKTKKVEPSLLNEMEKDVKRLETIAERFSKIGSNPNPEPVDLVSSIHSSVNYMNSRISSKVNVGIDLPDEPVPVKINDSLFAWVMENLIKNAVDAMEGSGRIFIAAENNQKIVKIDISDTGKGIPKSKFKTVFNPGYTTKARGWGLGLSLVKRIVESYHGGKIYVKSSELGKGTIFRIELPVSKE